VRCRATRSAFVLGSAALGVLGVVIVGCSRSSPGDGPAPSDLGIGEQVQIDQRGNEVQAVAGLDPVDPAGDGNAICPPVSIAMAGALSGPHAELGVNIKNGIQLAVDKHNAANPGCQVQLKPFDTHGDAETAAVVAPQILDDAYTIGLVGPTFSGEVKAAGDMMDQAGLVATTASATNGTLSENGWRTFFRGLASDGVQGSAIGNYLKRTLGHRKVCVVDDGTDDGLGLATAVRENLGALADSMCNIAVRRDDEDFSAAVTQIYAAAPDSVFFSGDYTQGTEFAHQLRASGDTGVFVRAASPTTAEFAEEYTAKFGQGPGAFSAEGYDLGTILLTGIDSGAITRPALLEYVRDYQGQGVVRHYKWTDNGELEHPVTWIDKVR
jgi:branched-chain amino acid transport system substrate-binding protein